MTKKRKNSKPKPNAPFPSREEIHKRMLEIGATPVSKEQLAKDRDEAIETIRHDFSLPDEGETAAVAIAREKTAALFYDRIWSPYAPLVPQEIHFCGATPAEVQLVMFMTQALRDQDLDDEEDFRAFIGNKFKTWIEATYSWEQGKLFEIQTTVFQRKLTEGLFEEHNIRVVPIYATEREQDSDFPRGDERAIIAALHSLPLPIETDLSWDQVSELRKDQASKLNLRRLVHWFGKDMVGKSEQHVADHLAITLDDYLQSLRKHGIRTTLSAMAGTFSAIGIPTLLTHIAQQPIWLSLLEGIAIGSGTLAKVAEKYIDTKPEPPAEVACLYEIKKRTK